MLICGVKRRGNPPWKTETWYFSVAGGRWSLWGCGASGQWILGAVEPPGMSSLWVWAVRRPGLCGIMISGTSVCTF